MRRLGFARARFRREPAARARAEGGFTLLESLVALVVLSVGMIGIAALYGQGLRAGRTAIYRTAAVNLAADMADRIRANRSGQAAYAAGGTPQPCGPGGSTGCSAAELAAYDLIVWRALVAAQLPQGRGAVEYAAGVPPTYVIHVAWHDVGGAEAYRTTSQSAVL